MKTKKIGVFALAAVLILTVALVTSCPEVLGLGDLSIPNSGAKVLRAGYLTLNLNVAGNNGRTILPDASQTFTSYEVDVEEVSGDGSNDLTGEPLTVTSGVTDTAFVQLPVGFYNIVVYAYTTVDGTEVLAAMGEANNAEVEATGGTTTITLEAYDIDSLTATDDGLFKWNLVLPTLTNVVDSASLTITELIGNTQVGAVRDVKITPINSAGVPLAPGYYRITATLTKANHASYTFKEIVHIYPGLTSTFQKTFPNLSRNVYTVTYSNIDNAGGTQIDQEDIGSPGTPEIITREYNHASLLTNYYSAAGLGGAKPSGVSGKVFDDWYQTYTAPTTYADPWDFGSDRIMKDTTLYAKWLDAIGIDITIDYSGPTGTPLTFTGNTTFTQAELTSNSAVIITFTNAGVFDNIAFEYTNPHTSATADISSDFVTTPGVTQYQLTLTFTNAGNMGLPGVGHYLIYVEADISGVPYTGTIDIEVTP